jgi:hypothetical protein
MEPFRLLNRAAVAHLLALAATLVACGGGGGGTAAPTPVPNASPLAVAGPDQSVQQGTTVTLDGQASSDRDGNALSFKWTLSVRPPGSNAQFASPTSVSTTFSADVPGTYTATLVVNDGKVDSVSSTVTVRSRRNYLRTSYELAQSDLWLSSADLYSADGSRYTTQNPLLVMQTVQVDIDGDGVEDIFTFDSYSLTAAIPKTPPSIFINQGSKLTKATWAGAQMRDPHGVKILVGDFNGDGFPDLFSLVAVDPPFGAFPDLQDFNNILFGSSTGFSKIKEFDEKRGFWYAGASGDINKDGALDIVIFNFHTQSNGVKNQILWNDGRGNFSFDERGIGDIPGVDQAELVDVNNDGFLDLVIDNVVNGVRTVSVLWGEGKGFSLANTTSFEIAANRFVGTINFCDIDGDGVKEIILSGVNDKGIYWLLFYKSSDKGKSFSDQTSKYIDISETTQRFDHLRVSDIDHNGRLDIFAPDRKDNIRWEWNGSKFVKQ